MKLYDNDGWLDIPHVVEVADKNNISFIVIIGKRQVGKTYGVLKYMLDYDVKKKESNELIIKAKGPPINFWQPFIIFYL